MYNTHQEARAAWAQDSARFAALGVHLPDVKSYAPQGWGSDIGLAMDALPTLYTTPNSSIPAFLTTVVDPTTFKVLFAKNKAAEILGEVKKGSWVDDTAMFPIIEYTGEVSSYGDYNENGNAGVNTNWPQRQAYLFQTIKEYGDRELERAGLAKINWATEIDTAAATVLNKYANLTYFYGVSGLLNYGLLNDPSLSAYLTPATKTIGGTAWFNPVTGLFATANEIYQDIQALFARLVAQSGGIIEQTDDLILVMSPTTSVALTVTNSFNVNVTDLLKKNFPNLKVMTAVQYGVLSATNSQGVAAGNVIQMIAPNVEGQQTGFAAYNEKMRAHKLIAQTSSYKQKLTGGTWGAVIRQLFAVAGMIGV